MIPAQFLADPSIEITARDLDALATSRASLRPGSAISITFLPGDDIQRLASAAAEVRALGFTPVPHISARRVRSATDLRQFLARLTQEAGVDRVFVIAGDAAKPAGPYEDAIAILRSGELASAGIRRIGVAGYPDGHPSIADEVLDRVLRSKLALLAAAGQEAEIVTQFGFEAAPIARWIADLRAGCIETPIRIGLAGPTSATSLMKFAARCGVAASAGVMSRYGLSLARLLQTVTADHLVHALADTLGPEEIGRVGAHLYPFGGVGKAIDWVNAFARGDIANQLRKEMSCQAKF